MNLDEWYTVEVMEAITAIAKHHEQRLRRGRLRKEIIYQEELEVLYHMQECVKNLNTHLEFLNMPSMPELIVKRLKNHPPPDPRDFVRKYRAKHPDFGEVVPISDGPKFVN